MSKTTELETEDVGRVALTADVRQCILEKLIEPLSHLEIGEMMKKGFEEAKLIQKACHFALYGRKY